jgi:hypothetical protein
VGGRFCVVDMSLTRALREEQSPKSSSDKGISAAQVGDTASGYVVYTASDNVSTTQLEGSSSYMVDARNGLQITAGPRAIQNRDSATHRDHLPGGDHWGTRWQCGCVEDRSVGAAGDRQDHTGLALGRALAAPVFSRDPIMAVLYRGRWPLLGRGSVPAMGLELQTVLLARQLELGQPAILECVAPAVACDDRRSGHRFISVVCVCTDPRRTVPASNSGPAAAPRIGLGQGGRDDAPLRQDEHADFVADAVRPVTELVSAIAELVRSQAP